MSEKQADPSLPQTPNPLLLFYSNGIRHEVIDSLSNSLDRMEIFSTQAAELALQDGFRVALLWATAGESLLVGMAKGQTPSNALAEWEKTAAEMLALYQSNRRKIVMFSSDILNDAEGVDLVCRELLLSGVSSVRARSTGKPLSSALALLADTQLAGSRDTRERLIGNSLLSPSAAFTAADLDDAADELKTYRSFADHLAAGRMTEVQLLRDQLGVLQNALEERVAWTSHDTRASRASEAALADVMIELRSLRASISADRQEAKEVTISVPEPRAIDFHGPISGGSDISTAAFLHGFHDPEANGVWTSEKTAYISIWLSSEIRRQGGILAIEFDPAVNIEAENAVTFSLKDGGSTRVEATSWCASEARLELAAGFAERCTVKIEMSNLLESSPGLPDQRMLGLFVKSIRVDAAPKPLKLDMPVHGGWDISERVALDGFHDPEAAGIWTSSTTATMAIPLPAEVCKSGGVVTVLYQESTGGHVTFRTDDGHEASAANDPFCDAHVQLPVSTRHTGICVVTIISESLAVPSLETPDQRHFGVFIKSVSINSPPDAV